MLARTFAPLLLILIAVSARGQAFERFGVRDGLSSETISGLAIDPAGVLWVATEDGLNRYDGHAFRSYRHQPDLPGTLPSSRVASVFSAQDGTIWVGTLGGLARLDRRTGRFTLVPGLPEGAVGSSIVEGAEGRIWVGTEQHGLWFYDETREQMVSLQLGFQPASETWVVVLTAWRDQVWLNVSHRSGNRACMLLPASTLCDDLQVAGSLIDTGSEPVSVDRESGRISWLTSGKTWILSTSLPAVFRSGIRASREELWLASENGIVIARADGTTSQIMPEPDRRGGLGGHDVRAFARDRQGSIWVGTEAGLYVTRMPAGPFETFRGGSGDPSTLSDARVNGMAEAEGSLWITTNDGLNRLDLHSGTLHHHPASIGDGSLYERAFWQVLITASGEMLVGTKRAGLWRLGLGGEAHLEHFSNRGVRSLVEDRQGRIWITIENGVWRREHDGPFARVPTVGGPPTPSNVVYSDARGQIWIGTDRGLLRYDPSAERLVTVPMRCETTTRVPNVWGIAESSRDPGALWLASNGGGLARFALASGEVECIGFGDGLPTDAVVSVLADDEGMLWAGTFAGLVRLDPRTREVALFTTADGLQGDAFNLMAALRLSDGRLAFGGPGGLTLVSPEAVPVRVAPRTLVGGFERAGLLAPGIPALGDTLRLAYNRGTFGIRFSALDFRAPLTHRYRYRLVGLDAGWQWTDGSAPRAAYASVGPGLYRFEVEGAAADTPFGETAVLWIEIVPAFWQTFAFRFSVLILGLAGVAGIAISMSRRRAVSASRAEAEAAEVRRRLANAAERERVRLARDLHDGPVQNLYSVGHDLDRLGESIGQDSIRPVRTRVGDVARSLRQMLVELRPTLAEHLGLGPALRTIARHAEERYPTLSITIRDETGGARPAQSGQIALFRIAQEAIENVGRHAEASGVLVRLRADRGGISLLVRDDGQGFAVPARMVDLARQEHFGLVGAKERAEAAGGAFAVRSVHGRGTWVEAWVPAEPTREAVAKNPDSA